MKYWLTKKEYDYITFEHYLTKQTQYQTEIYYQDTCCSVPTGKAVSSMKGKPNCLGHALKNTCHINIASIITGLINMLQIGIEDARALGTML